MLKNLTLLAAIATTQIVSAEAFPLLPGYLTDPTALKDANVKDPSYQPPEQFKYPYISTYYVKPTVLAGEAVKIGFFVTDFESSKIRFIDDSHRFNVFLEYGLRGGAKKIVESKDLKSGDGEINLGVLPVGDYEMRIWAVDQKGRASHRVIQDFRVKNAADLEIPADKVYQMTEADLAKYGIRNDGDLEKLVYVSTNGTETVVKEKRAGVPGYTVTVPMDPKTDKMPWQAFKLAKIVYDEGYDKELMETNALQTVEGIQKMLDEKAAAGFRKLVMLPGTYRISHQKRILLPDYFTLDLDKAVIKQNAFAGEKSLLVNLSSTIDSHLVGGTLEGDYWTHDYVGSTNGMEWVSGFELGGYSWYSSVENVKVIDITGYGGQNGVARDAKGWLSFFCFDLPKFVAGGLDATTGEVDASDTYRFTTDFADLSKILAKDRHRLQISRHLGYQGRRTRSWQMTVAWYDAEKKFLSSETSWQYREMWIPEKAAFLRVSVEEESVEAANKSDLRLTAMRLPVNCAIRNCTFDHCRCVGYAASAMRNYLFEANFFTRSGEGAACCAFDAEDGWDQMQDAYFLKNVFRENPRNNSILTCAGHNFILEGNDGDICFSGRTHSPCVRGNTVGRGRYLCDSRLRSGYGRFYGNTYSKGVSLGENDGKNRIDSWDYVVSGLDLSGKDTPFVVEVGCAGRVVNCTFKDLPVAVANAYACTFENCTDGSGYRPIPSGNWFAVTLKDCTFSRIYNTNNWDRCHFINTNFKDFSRGLFSVKNSDFTDCTFFGIRQANIELTDCVLNKMTVEANWWETPANLLFKNCTITMKEDAPFLKIPGYTIGKVDFDGCTVSGKQPLVGVKDLRKIQLPPKVKPEDSPDLQTGTIELHGVKWTGEGTRVVTLPKNDDPSPKKIVIVDKDNTWPEGTVVASDLPVSWELK